MSGMRIIIISIGIIIVLFLVVGLFIPSKSHIERSMVIKASIDSVFIYVADFKHYKQWNSFTSIEPSAQFTISGNPGEKGHQLSWVGDAIGTGKLTIMEIVPGEFIQSYLIFAEPDVFESIERWQFKPVTEGINITWINESNLKYPFGRYFGLFLDGMMGPEFEKGLTNLKNYSEK